MSIRKTAPLLGLRPTSLWKVLQYDINAKFYRPTSVQPLTPAHMEQRRIFCQWILEQPEEFVQSVIWTDKKFFVLHQGPNRKNDGKWSVVNPHETIETNDRNGKKVMLFVAIIDGKIPIVHPFIDEAGRPVSVNGSCYLSLLKNTVWPVFRSISTRRGLWWMQDGAPPHCTREAKEFLLDKFRGKVISRGTPINWPAHSPDLNPLDFHFWSEAQAEVYRKKPEDIESLIECVKTFAASYCSMTIRKVSTNVLKRAQLCVREQGGHFQHLLK